MTDQNETLTPYEAMLRERETNRKQMREDYLNRVRRDLEAALPAVKTELEKGSYPCREFAKLLDIAKVLTRDSDGLVSDREIQRIACDFLSRELGIPKGKLRLKDGSIFLDLPELIPQNPEVQP